MSDCGSCPTLRLFQVLLHCSQTIFSHICMCCLWHYLAACCIRCPGFLDLSLIIDNETVFTHRTEPGYNRELDDVFHTTFLHAGCVISCAPSPAANADHYSATSWRTRQLRHGAASVALLAPGCRRPHKLRNEPRYSICSDAPSAESSKQITRTACYFDSKGCV